MFMSFLHITYLKHRNHHKILQRTLQNHSSQRVSQNEFSIIWTSRALSLEQADHQELLLCLQMTNLSSFPKSKQHICKLNPNITLSSSLFIVWLFVAISNNTLNLLFSDSLIQENQCFSWRKEMKMKKMKKRNPWNLCTLTCGVGALHIVPWDWLASSLTAVWCSFFLPKNFPVFQPAQQAGRAGYFPVCVRYADLSAPQDNVSLVPLPKGMAGRCSGPKEIKELPGRVGQAFPFHLNILFVILSHS